MDLEKLLQSYGIEQWQFICFIFFPLFVIICMLFLFHRKRQQNNFIAMHPDTSCLVLHIVNGNGEIKIHSVDGEKPVETTLNHQKAILIAPGVHKIISSVNLETERGSVFLQGHGLGPSDTQTAKTEQELTIKPGWNYRYIFDASKFTYAICEIEGEK